MAKIGDPRVAHQHRDLIRRWVALVADAGRKMDESAHIEIAKAWSTHQQQNLRGAP